MTQTMPEVPTWRPLRKTEIIQIRSVLLRDRMAAALDRAARAEGFSCWAQLVAAESPRQAALLTAVGRPKGLADDEPVWEDLPEPSEPGVPLVRASVTRGGMEIRHNVGRLLAVC